MRWLLVLTALGGPTLPLFAQPQPAVAVGTEVRLRMPAGNGRFLPRFDGTVVRVSGDTLTLRPKTGGGSRIYTPSYENQLLVVTARRSGVARGAVIGGLSGLLAAGFVATLGKPPCNGGRSPCFIRRDVSLRNAAILGGGGSLLGALIGVLKPHKTWTRTWMPPAEPRVTMGTERGMNLGLSLAF